MAGDLSSRVTGQYTSIEMVRKKNSDTIQAGITIQQFHYVQLSLPMVGLYILYLQTFALKSPRIILMSDPGT